MNEKLFKKLGELHAFSEVGRELFEKNHKNLITVWSSDEVSLIIEKNAGFEKQINILADRNSMSKVMLTKAEKTKAKLTQMQDLYLADDTDPIEIMEWLSFFEGAAAAHGSLVLGMAQNNQEIERFTKDLISFHRELVEKVAEILFRIGKKKVGFLKK
jgi:hypothetical protein